ncbi:MAG: TGS domain-containing protein [Burkholderiales bacterium]|nr:TGS domain-containing protein [Burkholderiales bacterium]
MPANLTPEYRAAEAAYRRARDPEERLECLREMLRVMPKHKGTDHLQADLKRRIKELSEALEAPKKGGARGGPALVVRPEGAAQIALLGPPNAGKSALHARLTGSGAEVAPYPFTTQLPQAGMMPFEDIAFQLVDLPALSPEHAVPWLSGALQMADACLFVLDLAAEDCLEQLERAQAVLRERRIELLADWSASAEDDEGSRALRLPALLLANKADLVADPEGELRALLELSGFEYPALAVSAETGFGLGELGPWLFAHLGIVRVYTKSPGKPADRTRPFTLRTGQTVEDVARLVHKDLARALKYARLWGKSGFGGQQVGREHRLADGDIVELHA